MPISLEFSPYRQGTLTPTKKARNLDQLFSPRNQTLKIQTPTSHLPKTLNNMTYQVDTNLDEYVPEVEVHSIANYGANLVGVDDDIDLMNNPPNYFPRSSTGIKGPRPPVPEADVSTMSLQNTTIRSILTNEDDYIPQYKAIHQVRDSLPIRTACFHPSGEVYVIGTNSKKLSLFSYPNSQEFKHFNSASHDPDLADYYPVEPEYRFQFFQIHRGSVYCATFNNSGNLLATGSNDQSVHIIQYDSQKHEPVSIEYKLTTLHSGTVRDVMFMPGEENSSYLITASSDNSICITDCADGIKNLRVLKGHESGVMSLHHWNDNNMFVSGSLDGTIRMWDIRSKLCCKTIDTNRLMGGTLLDGIGGQKSGVNVVRVEQTGGNLLVSGHKDGRCMLYDIKAGKVVQAFKQHDDEIRTLNFSPKSYYLLTAGYDNKIKLMDLQGELSQKLPYVEIGELGDKIVQTSWHPVDYNFLTTCANGSAKLWAIPESQHGEEDASDQNK